MNRFFVMDLLEEEITAIGERSSDFACMVDDASRFACTKRHGR